MIWILSVPTCSCPKKSVTVTICSSICRWDVSRIYYETNHILLKICTAPRKLQRKGEKITSFVVIAAAKQVVMAQEPGLLHDTGGPVKLNTTWAKSMLRRLGIKNKID